MIEVFATTDGGDGYTQPLGHYETIDEIRIYTAALGPNVLITFFDNWTEEDEKKKEPETPETSTIEAEPAW